MAFGWGGHGPPVPPHSYVYVNYTSTNLKSRIRIKFVAEILQVIGLQARRCALIYSKMNTQVQVPSGSWDKNNKMSMVQITKNNFEYINKIDVQNRYTLRYTFTACRADLVTACRGGKIVRS